jgi:hypothetical protein
MSAAPDDPAGESAELFFQLWRDLKKYAGFFFSGTAAGKGNVSPDDNSFSFTDTKSIIKELQLMRQKFVTDSLQGSHRNNGTVRGMSKRESGFCCKRDEKKLNSLVMAHSAKGILN